MRTINLDVKLRFNQKVTSDEEIQVIMDNVLAAIKNQEGIAGVLPDAGDNYVKSVEVGHKFLGESVKFNFIEEKDEE